MEEEKIYITKGDAILALLEKGQHSKRYKLGETWELNLFEIQEAIDDMPAVDVPPVKYGKWEYEDTIGGMKHYHCTNCDSGHECIADENQILWWRFCPKCGARMTMIQMNEHLDKSTMDYVQNEVLNYLFNKEHEAESMSYSNVRQERIATLHEIIRYVGGIGDPNG